MDESGKKEKLLLYYDGESLSGKVSAASRCWFWAPVHRITQLNRDRLPTWMIIALPEHFRLPLCVFSRSPPLWPCYQCFVNLLQVNVTLKKPGAKLEHQGIKIELIGKLPKIILAPNASPFVPIISLFRPNWVVLRSRQSSRVPNPAERACATWRSDQEHQLPVRIPKCGETIRSLYRIQC